MKFHEPMLELDGAVVVTEVDLPIPGAAASLRRGAVAARPLGPLGALQGGGLAVERTLHSYGLTVQLNM